MFEKIKKFITILIREIQDDRLSEGAAALSFYLTLAAFPALISLLALVPYLPIGGLEDEIISFLKSNLPGETGGFVSGIIKEVFSDKRPALLSTGFIGAAWAASSGMSSVINQLNVAYDVEEQRGMVRKRLTAIALTLLYSVSILIASSLLILGDTFFGQEFLGSSFVQNLYWLSKLVISYLVLLSAFASLYHLAPNLKAKYKFITPGSLFGSTVLVLAALLFDFYISNYASYSSTYGSIGNVIVFMLWLYVASFVVLIGAEINAVYGEFQREE